VTRTLTHEQPQVARLSVAVMVDGVVEPGADGKLAWHERSAQDIDHLKRLAESAIGFDAKRGDTVEVVSMRFTQPPEESPAVNATLLGLALDKGDLVGLAQSGVLGVVVLLAMLFILRPMALRLTGMGETMMLAEGSSMGGYSGTRALTGPGGVPALTGPGGVPLLEDESMVQMANIEGQLRASSIRKLADMVEKHPEETLSIMRGWMAAERA